MVLDNHLKDLEQLRKGKRLRERRSSLARAAAFLRLAMENQDPPPKPTIRRTRGGQC